jgi:hypothetical protein
MRSKAEQAAQPWRGPIPQEVMQFWGYKFETLATLPAPWGETSRDYIEGREQEVVNNNAQYCSVVRTGLGKTVLCLGGEVDAGKLALFLSITETQTSPLRSQQPQLLFQTKFRTDRSSPIRRISPGAQSGTASPERPATQ